MAMPAPVLLAHDDLGAGRPVLLVHGFPLSRRLWAPQVAELSSRWRVISPDLRGHGASPATGGAYTMAHHAADLIALLERARTGPVAFVGLSMGGYVAFEVLRRRPDLVGALVLASTRAEADTDQGKERRRALASMTGEDGVAAFVEEFLPGLLSETAARERPDLVDLVRQIMVQTSPAGVTGSLLGMAERADSSGLLGSVGVPTLIVAAREDRAIPLEAAEAMHRGIPGASLARLAGGHLVNLEHPEEFSRELVRFLHEHWT
jgi:pimeloyl-ACP methyl ester carboxylesterase